MLVRVGSHSIHCLIGEVRMFVCNLMSFSYLPSKLGSNGKAGKGKNIPNWIRWWQVAEIGATLFQYLIIWQLCVSQINTSNWITNAAGSGNHQIRMPESRRCSRNLVKKLSRWRLSFNLWELGHYDSSENNLRNFWCCSYLAAATVSELPKYGLYRTIVKII